MWEEPFILHRLGQDLLHSLPYMVFVEVAVASGCWCRRVRAAATDLPAAICTLPNRGCCLCNVFRTNHAHRCRKEHGQCQYTCKNFLHPCQLLHASLIERHLPTSNNALFSILVFCHQCLGWYAQSICNVQKRNHSEAFKVGTLYFAQIA